MRKICFLLFACILFLHAGTYAQETRWQKAATPQWQAKQDTVIYWYAIDAEGKLALTSDNQKWVVASQPQWKDFEGNVYRIEGANLQVSNDTGKNWTNASNRFWRGSDGMWYGFDDSWTLWTGGTGNHPPMGIIGINTTNGGADAYTGTNTNGETTGINDNTGNDATIKLPNSTTYKSQGTKSAAEFNNTRSSGNTQTPVPK